MPIRGAKAHWCPLISELLAPGVPAVGLFPAMIRPELVIVSVPPSQVEDVGSAGAPPTVQGVYLYFDGSNAVSFPYFSESGPSKSQRTPKVTVRLLRSLKSSLIYAPIVSDR